MSRQNIHKAEDQAVRLSQRTLVPFGAKPNGDVQIIIGESRKGRNERGREVMRVQVKQKDFDAWTKAALFLHGAQTEP